MEEYGGGACIYGFTWNFRLGSQRNNIFTNRSLIMKYEDMIFKIPVESDTYKDDSDFVIRQITNILDERKRVGDDKIIINTNLVSGLP